MICGLRPSWQLIIRTVMQGIHLVNKCHRRPVCHESYRTPSRLSAMHARPSSRSKKTMIQSLPSRPRSHHNRITPRNFDRHNTRALCLSNNIPEPSREIMLFHNIHNLALWRPPTFNPIPPCVLEPVVQRHAHSNKDAEGIEGDVK